jgi:hypothetical protein
MVSIKSFFIPVFGLCVIVVAGYCADHTSTVKVAGAVPIVLVPVGESDWSVYMEAPNYHFELAREYLKKSDYSKASSELKRGNSFLVFQKNRLLAVSNEIEKLSNRMASSKPQDITRLDSITANALKVLSNKYAMIPLEVSSILVFEEEYEYLFDKAKTNVQGNNRAEAASEIRRAASLIRLKAAHTGNFSAIELDSAENKLLGLASRVASAAVVDVKEMEQIFKKAEFVFKKK